MKSLTLRSSVALACALTLAGCGGSSGNLQVSGRIYGLTRDGLVLQNNGGPPLTIPAGSSGYVFPELVGSDQDFIVTIKSMPTSAKCTVFNGKGRTGAFSITNVDINCVTNTYNLSGHITGLGDATGLVLINGADRKAINAGATTFTMTVTGTDGSFTGKVGDGFPYGVTILTQPAGRTCTVVNGVGTMGAADVDTVQVNCA